MTEKKKQMIRNIIAAVIVVAAIVVIAVGKSYYDKKIHTVTGNAAPAPASVQVDL